MMKKLIYLFTMMCISLFIVSCSNDESSEILTHKKGLLKIPDLSFDINIEVDNFSSRVNSYDGKIGSQLKRTTGSNIQDFVVQVLSSPDENIVVSFENYSEALALGSIPLPAGNYILRAFNDDFPSVSPKFDFPYFFGQSPVFTIEFEETTEIDELILTANNSKVTVNFSDNVQSQFVDYELSVTTDENNQTLVFDENEIRSGFFSSSHNLSLLGTFSFTRIDGTTDTRTIDHLISNIVQGTEYVINIDVTLEDGELVFSLILDDSFSQEIIDLGNGDIVNNEPFVPYESPIITSPINTFEENATINYNLTWNQVQDASYYSVLTGTSRFNLTQHSTNLSSNSIMINLQEGSNFFEVKAHFPDGSITSNIGGNFRKLQNVNNPINVAHEISPVNEIVYNWQNGEVNANYINFEANYNPNLVYAVKLHVNGSNSGQNINHSGGNINEDIDLQNGGMHYYYYSGFLTGTVQSRYDTYRYFTHIVNPDDPFNISQENNPLSVKINTNLYWGIGTPYFYVEKREIGSSSWEVVANGWTTSTEVYDYNVMQGKSYEYRFRVSNNDNFLDSSQPSQIQSITVN